MRRFMRMFRLLPLFATLLCSGAALRALAAEPAASPVVVLPSCPDDAAAQRLATPVDPGVSDEDEIELITGDVRIDQERNLETRERVEVRQGKRHLSAEELSIDSADRSMKVSGAVEYRDPQLVVRGDAGSLQNDQVDFEGAQFELPERSARGAAKSLSVNRSGILRLDGVRYTTCPEDDTDWEIKADRVSIDTARSVGTAHDARVEFLGVPIMRLPVITFPVGDARKSGVLFPRFGSTSSSGFELGVPYYLNLAPNQDLTLTPTWYSKRGIDLAGDYRYLTRSSRGNLIGNLLPSDKRENDTRSRLKWENLTELPRGWRLIVDAENVSDALYFEDFFQGGDGASVAFLPRLLQLSYRGDHLDAGVLMRNYQTLDQELPQDQRPYTELPRLFARGSWQLPGALPLRFGVAGEATAFERSAGIEGWRVNAMPQAELNYQGPGYFVRPALALDATWYDLKEDSTGSDNSPERVLPIASLDTGLLFERATGKRGGQRMTLEPRLMYLYVPYKDQSELPVFDTAEPDLNWIELFRTNRYVGIDRISDANQISAGLTTQLYSSSSGTRYLSTTLGQIYYFDTPRVHLPDEAPVEHSTSDFIAQVELQALSNWNFSLDLQVDPHQKQAQRSEARVRYQPAPQNVINVGYRYQHERLEQLDVSTAWPITDHWRLYGRSLYSFRDSKSIDSFAGFEYNSCCWRLRTVARQYVSRRSGDRAWGFYVQLELKGLSNVGQAADAFLEGAIRGYSASTRPR
jgi:LPS-assembly protein